jgi:hypothetical protein
VGTYPCSNCGAHADIRTGCPTCGRSVEQEIAELDHVITSMQFRNAAIADQQGTLQKRLQGAMITRSLLRQAMTQQRPSGVAGVARRAATRTPTRPRQRRAPVATARRLPDGTLAVTAPPVRPGKSLPLASTPRGEPSPLHQPEASTGSMQNALLGLGALLFAATAIALSSRLRTMLGAGGREVLFILLTAGLLAVPLALARRSLTATAETVAVVGLLFVLLDGQHAWPAFAGSGLPGSAYAGLVTLAAAALAAGYRRLSPLLAPRFAVLVLAQPVLPLLLGTTLHTPADWAGVLAAVAVQDVALALVLGRTRDPRRVHTPRLLDAAYLLHAVAVLAAACCAAAALVGARTPTQALAGTAGLLLAGAAGLAGGLLLGRTPLPGLGSGLAVLAVIGALGRLGAVLLPGRGLMLTAVAVLAVSLGVPFIAPVARTGAQRAVTLAAGVLGLVILGRGFDAILAPLLAASPAWRADLHEYPAALAAAAGTSGWQLAVAAILLTIAAARMLPVGIRADGAVAGGTLALLLVPAGTGLAWAATPPLVLLGAVAAAASGLLARTVRAAWIRGGAAALLACYATDVALARASAGALVLGAIVLAGAAIGGLGTGLAARPRVLTFGAYTWHTADGALAVAALALPGAVAFGTVALAPPGSGPLPVLAASYLAVAGTLAGAALAQVAAQAPNPILVTGATLGSVVVAISTFVTSTGSPVDIGVAVLLLIAGVSLLLAPALNGRTGWLARLSGPDLAAVLVTTAALAALARVTALVVPRYPLVTASVLVLLLALGIRSMPPAWRSGPIVGGSVIAAAAAAAAATGAVSGVAGVLRALGPVWHTDLAGWHVSQAAAFGAQAPVALVLLAVAARVALPPPWSKIAGLAGIGLAALALPAGFGLGWWSPILLSGAVAAAAGLVGAVSPDARVAWTGAGTSALLLTDAVAAGLVDPSTTAAALAGAALVLAGVAGTAAVSWQRHQATGVEQPGGDLAGDAAATAGSSGVDHLVAIGGSALAASAVALAAAAGCAVYARHAPLGLLFTAAFAVLCLSLAVSGLACYNNEKYLPHLTAGLAVGGTAIAIATLRTAYPAEVYAAGTAMLVVLAELLYVAAVTRRASLSGAGLRAAYPALRVPKVPLRPGYAAMLAAGPATVIAMLRLAPSVVAALIGPYQWLGRVWHGAPARADQALDGLASWIGTGTVLVAAMLLTLAAALAAAGLGGTRTVVVARSVAVVIPGLAITLLIAPAVLRAPWASGPVSALAVSAIAGLGVALTPAPPDALAARPLRRARRLVVVIAALAGGAGLAGSLATRGMTLAGLAAAMLIGLAAALFGRGRPARLAGWLVTASAGHLLALVAGLVGGLPAYESAFGVAAVSCGLLVLAALLPRLRRPDAVNESTMVEASSYAGAVLALLLASRSLPHLAVFCTAWGAVLGLAAARPGRSNLYRSVLFWFAAAHEVAAWWLLMRSTHVRLAEAYTLAVAVVAVLVGYVEYRRHPNISSWYAYGMALAAGFLPSLAIVLATGQTPLRRALLIVGAAVTVAYGALRGHQAPVFVGGAVLVIAALYEVAVLSAVALLLVLMGLVGVGLVGLGANYEKRRHNLNRIRGAIGRLR